MTDSNRSTETERVSDELLARLIDDHRDPYCTRDDCDFCDVRHALQELQRLRSPAGARDCNCVGFGLTRVHDDHCSARRAPEPPTNSVSVSSKSASPGEPSGDVAEHLVQLTGLLNHYQGQADDIRAQQERGTMGNSWDHELLRYMREANALRAAIAALESPGEPVGQQT